MQERIELGKQGYDKSEVENACADAGKSDGVNFWEALTKDVVTNLANGLTDGLSKGLDKGLSRALGARERNSTAAAPTSDGARECVANAANMSAIRRTDWGWLLLSGIEWGHILRDLQITCTCEARLLQRVEVAGWEQGKRSSRNDSRPL